MQSAWIKYSTLGLEMAVTIGIGAGLGYWADSHFNSPKPYYTILGCLIFLAIALFRVIKVFLKKDA
jgi:F0F1-type ATP synthase assembly protein I